MGILSVLWFVFLRTRIQKPTAALGVKRLWTGEIPKPWILRVPNKVLTKDCLQKIYWRRTHKNILKDSKSLEIIEVVALSGEIFWRNLAGLPRNLWNSFSFGVLQERVFLGKVSMARFMALVSRMLWIKKKLNGAIQLRGETVLGEILQSGESVQNLFLQRAPFNNVLKSYQCHYSWHYFQGCWKWKKNWKRSCLRGGIPILCFSSCSLDIRT